MVKPTLDTPLLTRTQEARERDEAPSLRDLIRNTSGDSSKVLKGDGTFGTGGGSGRTILTQDTTFYVSTTGSDTTGDGSVGNPWATIQHAVNVVTYGVQAEGCGVTIQIGDGTYDENIYLIGNPQGSISADGNTVFTLQGNLGDAAAVVINPNSAGPSNIGGTISVDGATWTINSLTVKTQTVNNEGIAGQNNAVVFVGTIIFGDDLPSGGTAAFAFDQNSCIRVFSATFVGTVSQLAQAFEHSFIDLNPGGGGITFQIDPVLDAGLFSVDGDSCILSGSWSGSAASPGQSSITRNSKVVDSGAFTTAAKYTVDSTSSYNGALGGQSKSGVPAATDLAPGTSIIIKDTSGGGVYLAYNDGGTIKKVALT